MKLYIHINHDWSLSVGSIKTESTEVPKYTDECIFLLQTGCRKPGGLRGQCYKIRL